MQHEFRFLKRAPRALLLYKFLVFATLLTMPLRIFASPAEEATPATPSSPGGHVQLGINGDWDWVDLIKGLSGWNTVGSAASVPQDSVGWPMSDCGMDYDQRKNMPYRGVDAQGINEDFAGIYNLYFKGQAQIVPNTEAAVGGLLVQNQKYDAATNETTAQIVLQPGHSLLQLQFLNTKRLPTDQPGTGFTNMRLLRPGFKSDTQSIFTPGSLAAYRAPFAAIRFLEVDQTSNYQSFYSGGLVTAHWADRVQVTDAYQAGIPSRNANGKQSQGVAWEYMLMLANESHHDMWINIPISADDEYVAELANLLRNGNQYTRGLDKDLHVYVELSNEVWNYDFPQAIYNSIQGSEEGLTPDQRYIEHTFQIAQLFESVFGETCGMQRVRPVALWQQTTEMTLFRAIAFEEQASGLRAKDLLYGLGEAPYYNPSDFSTVQATLDTIWTGADSTRRDLIGWQAVSTFYGLHEVQYEGGPGSLVGGTGGYAIRDPRIGPTIVHQYVDNWAAIGGDVANYFELRGSVSEFGDFLLVEDYEHLNTPTYEAAQQVLNTATPAITAGQVLPFTVGQYIVIDPSQRTPDIYQAEATPGSGLTIQQGSPNLYLLRATGQGRYQLRLFGHASDSSAQVNVLVDDVQVGTITLGASDGPSAGMPFTVNKGFHTLSLSPTTGDTTILPPGTGRIVIALESGWGTPVAPSAPANLTAQLGDSQVALEWAQTGTANTYTVSRSTQSGGPYTPIRTLNTNSYTDTHLTNGTTYYYVVSATNAVGTGAISPQISVFPSPTTAPGTPAGVNITSSGGDFDPFFGNAIAILTWAPVTNAFGYNIYKSTDGTNYTLLNYPPQSGTQYTDMEINNGSTYYYAVTAATAFGESAKSQVVTASPIEEVRQSPVLTAQNRNGFVFLTWIPDPLTTLSFNTLFNVKRSDKPDGPFTTIIQNSTYNAYDFTAVPGKTYYYVVTATNGSGESAPSNEADSRAYKAGYLGYLGGSSTVPLN